MTNYKAWLVEIEKYKTIVEMVKHISVNKYSGRPIDIQLGQLQKLVDDCELTKLGIAGTEQTPLSGAVDMLQQNLEESLIDGQIEEGWAFYNAQHEKLRECIRANGLDS